MRYPRICGIIIPMADVTGLLFDLPALHALEGVFDHADERVFPGLSRLGFNVTPAPELLAASLATGNAVIGVIVGKFEGGGVGPAGLALEGDVQLV